MQRSAAQTGGGLAYSAQVFADADLVVHLGANAGDPLRAPAVSVAGDVYRLVRTAQPRRLALSVEDGGQPGPARVATGSELGAPGSRVVTEGRLILMAPDGDRAEVLVLRLEDLGRVALPLTPLSAGFDYTLIAADPEPGPFPLAESLAGAFAAGTRIALADGRHRPVEALVPGDLVLTRDHAAQPLRWAGAVRLRATGDFAPVCVLPGVMGNPRALVVSPHHRLFLYRLAAAPLVGSAELLVQARHLVDDQRIIRREGGFVDYYGLVFDQHEVIYAEGIPCESLRVSPAVVTALPEALAAPLRAAFPHLDQRLHVGTDLPEGQVARLRGRPPR